MPQSVTIVPATGHALLATQGGTGASPGYDAVDLRRMMLVAASRAEGVFDPTGWRVRERAAGADRTVEVDANVGLARVEGSTGAGPYGVAPHSGVLTLDVPAASTTNPRVDRIVLDIRDGTFDGTGFYDAQVLLLAGTPTAGATLDNRTGAQGVPASAIHLADVIVAANAAAITTAGSIRDYRAFAGGAGWTPGDMKFSSGSGGIGWIPADFRALRRLVHGRLFAETGTRQGAGDGSLTFNVADMRGRVPVGAGGVAAGRLTAGDARGATVGSEKYTLAEGQLPPHAHPVADPGHGHPVIDPGHAHNASSHQFALHRAGDVQSSTNLGQPGDSPTYFESLATASNSTGITVGNTTSRVSVGNAGGGQPYSAVQPGLVEQYFVFTGSVAA